jgi:hypothetical protein
VWKFSGTPVWSIVRLYFTTTFQLILAVVFDFLDGTQYNGKKRMVSKQIDSINSEHIKGLRKIALYGNAGQNGG